MLRLAGLDAPGILHHVIIRRIERRASFRDKIKMKSIKRVAGKRVPMPVACFATGVQASWACLRPKWPGT